MGPNKSQTELEPADMIIRVTRRPTMSNSKIEKILVDLEEEDRRADQQMYLPLETKQGQ